MMVDKRCFQNISYQHFIFYQLLSTLINLYQPSSTFINFYQPDFLGALILHAHRIQLIRLDLVFFHKILYGLIGYLALFLQ